MKTVSIMRAAITAMMIAVVAVPAHAQGKSAEKKKPEKAKPGEVVADKKVEKAARKRVTTSQAVVVTRDVLVANGYQIVNVVPTGATQVIYYRRGNRGNGRGLGPVEKIVVVPSGEIVRFQAVPEPLLATILRRLGL